MPKGTSEKQRTERDGYGSAQIVGVEKLSKGLDVLLPFHEVMRLMDAVLSYLGDKQNNPHTSAGKNSAAVLRVDLAAGSVSLRGGTWKPTYTSTGQAASRLRREARRTR